jgi:hypothetical protein
MTDIPKLLYVENARKAFRFTITKNATPAPAVPVDEASVNILETMQKRALAEAHLRALAELVEAQKLPEAETQKPPQPLPLSAEEQAQEWRAVFITENAQKLDLEDRQKLQELALQQRIKLEQAVEDARKLAEGKALIDQLHEREFVARRTHVAHVTHVTPVAPVKPVRIRRIIPGYL